MLPRFFIVGAAKSATSSLDRYLNQHFDIFMAPQKETHYFASSVMTRFNGPGDERVINGTIKDLKVYEELFEDAKSVQQVGESSVYYLYYHERVIPEMKALVPNAKIIISLRNPVDRAFSAYMHLVRDSRETLSFSAGIEAIQERQRQGFEPIWDYIGGGRYSAAVQHYIEEFGRQHVKVILYDDIVDDILSVMNDIFEFLNVSQKVSIDTSLTYNVSGIPKNRWLYDFLIHENAIRRVAKMFMPGTVRYIIKDKLLRTFYSRDAFRQPAGLTNEMRQILYGQFFHDDIEQLERTIRQDLSKWKYK